MTRWVSIGSAALLAGLLAGPSLAAEPGAYVKGGIGVGIAAEDSGAVDDLAQGLGAAGASLSIDPGADIHLAGGYNINEWLAGEASMDFIVGATADASAAGFGSIEVDLFAFEFLVSGKLYPLGLADAGSDWLDPYALVGIGGGRFTAEAEGFDVGESSFIARFGGGVEAMMWDNVGIYAEGSFDLVTESKTLLTGIGRAVGGAIYRFEGL